MERRSKQGVQAITAVVLLLAILLVVNLISTQIFGRVDLTEGKIYTLSKGSRELVRNLEDPLTIKAYFSENLPAPYNNTARFLRDQLDDYKAYSGGKLKYEFADPLSEEELEKEAQGFQIPPVQVNAVEKDRLEVKKVYMGLVFLYQDRHETIPLIQNTAGLEYDITSTIKRLTTTDRTSVGVLQGLGAPDMYQQMNQLGSVLERNYDIRPVDLSRNQLIPDDVDVLLIAGIEEEVDDWTMFAIDQFIMRGGKTAFLLNKVVTNLQEQKAQKAPFRIDDWTKNYGFAINDDLVMDKSCGMVNMQQRMGFFTISNPVNYPYFPIITSFSSSHPIAKDLENITLFFPSTIDTTYAAGKELDITPLFFTSEQCKLKKGSYAIDPKPQEDFSSYTEGPFVLGAALEGAFTSYFENREIPRGDTTLPQAAGLSILPSSPETRIVVVGEGNFAKDMFASDPSNVAFLMNMVDWLAMEEELIDIRTRDVTFRPLAEVSTGVKTTVKYANIFAPPAIVILIGLIRWQIRRRRKNVEFLV
ncbi:hypothetical protein CEE37_02150 [candidate division LCP-89 bacterium B3_LCP]|uniref:Uncharacterized protein n=1 Tax=candidate division LCP-89 bacterium B3_LCP TaxID=2012998 RepID=A0A532V5N8_UNCL8|nr:MAG: hypothetical protein CEE37_02150 [candidate division LCP-89 bacterium B3_LCP]